jgi:hypothetical protein
MQMLTTRWTLLIAVVLSSLWGGALPSVLSCAEARTKHNGAKDDPIAVQAILQVVIDDAGLSKFFHPELPSRRPLRVLKNRTISAGVKLMKFGTPVIFVEPDVLEAQAALEFRRIEIESETATVELRYRVEGVTARFDLNKVGNQWVVKARSIRESSR